MTLLYVAASMTAIHRRYHQYRAARLPDSWDGFPILSSYCVLLTVGGHDLQVAFLAIMSTSVDWTRRRTPKSDDWIYLPTVYPADSYITMQPRGGRAAAASA